MRKLFLFSLFTFILVSFGWLIWPQAFSSFLVHAQTYPICPAPEALTTQVSCSSTGCAANIYWQWSPPPNVALALYFHRICRDPDCATETMDLYTMGTDRSYSGPEGDYYSWVWITAGTLTNGQSCTRSEYTAFDDIHQWCCVTPTPTTGPSPTPTRTPTPTPTFPPGTPTPTPPSGCYTSGSSWQNFSMSNQTGSFTVEYDATSNGSGIDSLTMLSQGTGSAWSDYAVLVRFAPSGRIDARNAGSYSADTTINYSTNTTYHFRLEIDVPAKRYSVYVALPGSSPQLLANNYAFRSEQSGVTSLNNWGIRGAVGSHQVCNFQLGGGAGTPTPTPPTSVSAKGILAGYGTSATLLDIFTDGLVNILDWLEFLNPTAPPPTPTGTQPTATPTPSGPTPTIPPFSGEGIWISKQEIMSIPDSGTYWNRLKSAADNISSTIHVPEYTDNHDVHTLASALVAVRLNSPNYYQKTLQALLAAIDGEQDTCSGCTSVGLSRNIASYAIAADLIKGYDPSSDSLIADWLYRAIRYDHPGGDGCSPGKIPPTCTVIAKHENRPNNHGTMAGTSRVAVAAYRGDTGEVAEVARLFKRFLGDTSINHSYNWNDKGWQCYSGDESKYVGINPLGCIKQGHDIGGAQPEEMRRSCSFTWPPCKSGYNWEGLQGMYVMAIILHRQGYDVFNWEDQALKRAVEWLYSDVMNFPATGDDLYLLPLIDYIYSTNYWDGTAVGNGKNMGWTDWTHQ